MTEPKQPATLTEQETQMRLRAAAFVGVGVPALIYFGIMAAIESEWVLCALDFITSATIVVCFLILWQRCRGYAAIRPAIACYTALLLYLVAFSGPEHVRALWFLTLPLVSSLLLPPREGGIWAAGSMLMAAYLMLQGGQFDGSSGYSAAYILRFSIVYSLLSAVLIWSEILLQRYQARLQGQNAALAEERDRLEKEITARAVLEEELRYLATTDPLTGLLNRRGLEEAYARLARDERERAGLGVLLIDLDGFKAVNDSHGHEAGDELLMVVARRIETIVRRSDKVARIGGDEFVVLLDTIKSIAVARNIAGKLVDSLGLPFSVLGGVRVSIGASLGVVYTHYPPEQIGELLRRADAAMYEAKKGGKSQYRIAFPA